MIFYQKNFSTVTVTAVLLSFFTFTSGLYNGYSLNSTANYTQGGFSSGNGSVSASNQNATINVGVIINGTVDMVNWLRSKDPTELKAYAIGLLSIIVVMAISLTILHFVRSRILRKRLDMDKRLLLRSSISSEGYVDDYAEVASVNGKFEL